MPYHKPAKVNQVFCYPLIIYQYNRRFILFVCRYIRSFHCPVRTPGTGYVESFNHVFKFFWNIKTVFRSNRTEQNVKSRQLLITSKLWRRKAWFLTCFRTLFFVLFLLFIGIIVIAQKTKFGYRSFVKLSFIETQ